MKSRDRREAPLEALRVLEIAGSAAGARTARLFAEQGCDVVKAGPARATPEWPPLDVGKRLVFDDPSAWLDWADVTIESAAPGPLRPVTDHAPETQRVRVLISPYGTDGPLAGFRSAALTDDAAAGHLYLNGRPDRPPVARPGAVGLHQAGVRAFIAAVAAIRERRSNGLGCTVEVTHLEALAEMHQHTLAMWTHGRHVLKRRGARQPGPWHPAGLYPCRDGSVCLVLSGQALRDRFLCAAELFDAVLDPRFADDLAVDAHADAFDELICAWLAERTVEDVLGVLLPARVPVAPVGHLSEAFANPELRDTAAEPTRAFVLSPTVGDDAPAPRRAIAETASSGSPLEGVRVLDLGRVFAGPLAGRMLADLGADVVVVEAPSSRCARAISIDAAKAAHLFPEDDPGSAPWNRIGSINALHRNKRSIALDLHEPTGRALLERLIERTDVLLENFAPGVLGELGLHEDRLRRLNPGLIHTSISGYASSGPASERVVFGPMIEAHCGLPREIGYAGDTPCRSGLAWVDPVAATHAVAGTLVALERGSGCRVDIAMSEAALFALGGIDASDATHGAFRGSRDPAVAPQGVYPCAGEDRFVALRIESDAEWRRLAELAALPPALAALDRHGRHGRHDEIDAALATWTKGHEAVALTQRLQAAGLIAAWVCDARDLFDHPQLAHRGFWQRIVHPETGSRLEGIGAWGTGTHTLSRPAPRLGEHNVEVLRDRLGLHESAVRELVAGGVLATEPPA